MQKQKTPLGAIIAAMGIVVVGLVIFIIFLVMGLNSNTSANQNAQPPISTNPATTPMPRTTPAPDPRRLWETAVITSDSGRSAARLSRTFEMSGDIMEGGVRIGVIDVTLSLFERTVESFDFEDVGIFIFEMNPRQIGFPANPLPNMAPYVNAMMEVDGVSTVLSVSADGNGEIFQVNSGMTELRDHLYNGDRIRMSLELGMPLREGGRQFQIAFIINGEGFSGAYSQWIRQFVSRRATGRPAPNAILPPQVTEQTTPEQTATAQTSQMRDIDISNLLGMTTDEAVRWYWGEFIRTTAGGEGYLMSCGLFLDISAGRVSQIIVSDQSYTINGFVWDATHDEIENRFGRIVYSYADGYYLEYWVVGVVYGDFLIQFTEYRDTFGMIRVWIAE
ncbi:MAG: hypothetical protein FWC67_01000, partial [Defluviitaleaceae bacterium]|nr:hypothetical protein [Defluviitaleaceae bacterium]